MVKCLSTNCTGVGERRGTNYYTGDNYQHWEDIIRSVEVPPPHHTRGKASIFQVGLGFGKIGDVENAFGENLESI